MKNNWRRTAAVGSIVTAFAVFAAGGLAAQGVSFALDDDGTVVVDPANPTAFDVCLEVTTDFTEIASLGTRLIYDSARVEFIGASIGPDAPGSWSFVFATHPGNGGPAGFVDLVATDITPAAAFIPTAAETRIACVTFETIPVFCSGATFVYNATSPVTQPEIAAFPSNQYIEYIDIPSSSIILAPATVTTAHTGPSIDDHSFIRGNTNSRTLHVVDIQDVVDLVAFLFQGLVPGFDCEAAFDVNNDGDFNVTDVVTLVHGVFGTGLIDIPPPFPNRGAVLQDGGTVPSELGCAEGETCP